MIQKILERNENSRLTNVMRNALSLASPFMLIGAFALILRDFPNQEYQTFIQTALEGIIFKVFSSAYQFTLGSFSLILSIAIGISYRNQVDRNRPGIYLLISMISYLILVDDGLGNTLLANHFSVLYSTVAIFVSYVACSVLTMFIERMTQKLEPFSVLGDTHFSMAVHSVKPILMLLILMLAIRAAFFALFGSNDLPELIQIVVNAIFAKATPSFGWGLLYVFVAQVLAFFGVAGFEPLQSVEKVFETCVENNQYSIAMHEANPVFEVYSTTFIKTFCMIGGFGSVLSLIIALFFATKDRSDNRIGKALIIPSCFNIGETALFGLPIIFNPILLIPFILVPIVQYLFSSLLVYTGIVSAVINSVDTIQPFIFSGYFATNSISGPVLQILNIAIGTVIYIPFVRLLNYPRERILGKMLPEMERKMKEGENVGHPPEFLNGEKVINVAAKNLLSDLYDSIRQNEIVLYYQPQMGNNNEVIGAEGLFRWKHPQYGFVYPPLAVQLVKEDGFSNQLSYLFIQKACSALQRLHIYGVEHFKLSVNILPQQLETEDFAAKVKDIISQYDFGSCTLALEITEQGALASMPYVEKIVKELQTIGVDLIIDDFGMGHSSMSSMQNNHFRYVKLDGNLVKDVMDNKRTADIIQAICNLANKLDCRVVAEYVETEEQKEKLRELGCEIYQGYLYSKALPFDEFVDFLKESGYLK